MKSLLGKFILSIIAMVTVFYLRDPVLFKGRDAWTVLVLIIAGVVGILSLLQWCQSQQKITRVLSAITVMICLGVCCKATHDVTEFFRTKQKLFSTSPDRLEKIGQHFIVGYTNIEDVKRLVNANAIGGIFITRRNIKGKSFATVQNEIKSLQDLRKSMGKPPLIVATDQEGGLVSKLSPLLTPLPSLSDVISNVKDKVTRDQLVTQYAELQAKELHALGVNMNFGPVVDLRILTKKKFFDRHSLINKRAISDDPKIVAEVAAIYSKVFVAQGVIPTLKHFPGLGRIETDTHFDVAKLELDVAELEKNDWIPFRDVITNNSAALMLGHVILSKVDAKHTASTSKTVVHDIIRRRWQHRGLVITDDFSMGPIFAGPGGIEKATVNALNAGVDYILISYDPDLYYSAAYAAIEGQSL